MCGAKEPEEDILLCDHCSRAYHLACVELTNIPLGDWKCSDCEGLVDEMNVTNSSHLDPVENRRLWDYL